MDGPPGNFVTTLVTMIAVEHLSKRYGRQLAVDDISFSCEPGTVTGFLGPNGAGKSTTLRMICGLTNPNAGTASVLGTSYRSLPNPGREVGVLLDASAQHSGRSGREALTLTAKVLGVERPRVDELMEYVGLSKTAAKKRVGTYSLGMRQRLGIAQALVGDPRVLILDEPANGLDPEGIAWMRRLLRDFADRAGTVLLSSHLLREVEAVADQLVVIGNGKIVAQGSKQELLAATGVDRARARPGRPARGAGRRRPDRHPRLRRRAARRGRGGGRGPRRRRGRRRPARAAARRHRRPRGALPLPDLHRPRGGPDLMSTAVIARPGIPRLAAVELRKSADTRAGFWLLLVIVLLAAALVTLSLVFGEEADHNLSTLLSDSVQVISIVLPVLGILLVTSEWSQRTGLTTFALVPQRERIVVAKTIGATILTLVRRGRVPRDRRPRHRHRGRELGPRARRARPLHAVRADQRCSAASPSAWPS